MLDATLSFIKAESDAGEDYPNRCILSSLFILDWELAPLILTRQRCALKRVEMANMRNPFCTLTYWIFEPSKRSKRYRKTGPRREGSPKIYFVSRLAWR